MHHLILPCIVTLAVVSTVAATPYQKDRNVPNLPLAGLPAGGFDNSPVNIIQQGGDLPVHGGSGRSDPLVGPVPRLDIVGGSHGGPHKPIIPVKEPIVHPKKSIIQSRRPIGHPKKPIGHPKKPIVHPKKPIVHPKKPIVHPKKPIVHPKKPIVHPKKPIIDPFKSIDPLGVGGFQPGQHINPFGQGKVVPGFDHQGLGPVDHRFKKPSPVFPQAY